MKTEIIKQLKNSAWIVRFIDENGKSYVRFVSDSIVSGVWGVKKVWADGYIYIEEPKKKEKTDAETQAWAIEKKHTKKVQGNKGYQAWLRSVGGSY